MTYTIPDFGPADLLTSEREKFRRVRVDVAQTGFFEGREFRSFLEFDIPTGQSIVGRFSSPVNFILFQQALTVDSGAIKMTAEINGTPAGTYGTAMPVVGKNRMTTRPQPYYTAQATINTGGTYTGGTIVEVVRVVSANASAHESTVGGSVADERGLPPGDYYIRLANIGTGAAKGVYNIFWEERP